MAEVFFFFLFLYAFLYKGQRTSVVIVPTLSLMQDLMRRATMHGILCTNQTEIAHQVSLLFITHEAAVQNVTTDAIFQLQSSDLLGKIFIDEAHLFATEGDFRPSFRQLPLEYFESMFPNHLVSSILQRTNVPPLSMHKAIKPSEFWTFVEIKECHK